MKGPCWSCDFQKIGGVTFLGECRWFEVAKRQPPKAIPPSIVDDGCKFWKKREERNDEQADAGADDHGDGWLFDDKVGR